MFKDHSYATHADMRSKPFANIIDLSELSRERAVEYFDDYAAIVLATPLKVQIEREIQRRGSAIQRLAKLFDCEPEMLKDMARRYTLLHNNFCHTGLIVTCHPLVARGDFSSVLHLPNGTCVDFNFVDRESKHYSHQGRFNVLALPEFMADPDMAPLRREFVELFFLTMHDHMHDIFYERIYARQAPRDYKSNGDQPWEDISLNIRLRSALIYEPFLREATLAAGCLDSAYLEHAIDKVENISIQITGYCKDPNQIRTCEYMLYWMGRYILPEWDEYEWRLREAIGSLSPYDINKLIHKLNENYKRENPSDFSRFRALSADEMQLEILAFVHDLNADVSDFIHRVDPVMKKSALRPFASELIPA